MNTRTSRTILRAGGLLLAALLMSVASAAAQSAEEVVSEAMERWDAQLEGVRSVAVVRRTTEPSGRTTTDTARLVKRTIEGHAHLVPPEMAGAEGADAAGVRSLYEGLGEAARYDGTATVDGHACHVVVVDDPEALDRWLGTQLAEVEESSEGPLEVTLTEARAYLDAETYALRRQEMSAEVTQQGRTAPMDMEVTSGDYREVDGLLYPFRRVTEVVGLTGAMSPEELEEARKGMREMEEQLEEMSPQEREMAEAYMGDRMEKWRRILESGTVTTVIEVLELEVDREPAAGP